MADFASSTNFAGTLKVPRGTSSGVSTGGSNEVGSSAASCPCTVHITSDGLAPLCTSVRAAFRQPSKSVSLSRVTKRVWWVLDAFDSIGESPRIQIRLTPQPLLALY